VNDVIDYDLDSEEDYEEICGENLSISDDISNIKEEEE
jgi:hypothetical protein